MGFSSDVLELLRLSVQNVNGEMCRAFQTYDLTFNQAEVLLEIADYEGLTISQLEERTGVTKSNLSTLITKLEMRDLVERRRDSSDRHYVHIYLTPYSRSIVETLRREMNVAKELSLGFSPSEQAVVTQLLQRLSDQNKVTA